MLLKSLLVVLGTCAAAPFLFLGRSLAGLRLAFGWSCCLVAGAAALCARLPGSRLGCVACAGLLLAFSALMGLPCWPSTGPAWRHLFFLGVFDGFSLKCGGLLAVMQTPKRKRQSGSALVLAQVDAAATGAPGPGDQLSGRPGGGSFMSIERRRGGSANKGWRDSRARGGGGSGGLHTALGAQVESGGWWLRRTAPGRHLADRARQSGTMALIGAGAPGAAVARSLGGLACGQPCAAVSGVPVGAAPQSAGEQQARFSGRTGASRQHAVAA